MTDCQHENDLINLIILMAKLVEGLDEGMAETDGEDVV